MPSILFSGIPSRYQGDRVNRTVVVAYQLGKDSDFIFKCVINP